MAILIVLRKKQKQKQNKIVKHCLVFVIITVYFNVETILSLFDTYVNIVLNYGCENVIACVRFGRTSVPTYFLQFYYICQFHVNVTPHRYTVRTLYILIVVV